MKCVLLVLALFLAVDADAKRQPATRLPEFLLVDVDNDGICEGRGLDVQRTRRLLVRTVAWTCQDEDDAWLVLDQNSNGRVDSLEELVGGGVGPTSGLEYLAHFDGLWVDGRRSGGGNGVLSSEDTIFARLVLWHDRNADGRSQEQELSGASYAGLVSVALDRLDPPSPGREVRGLVSTGQVWATTRTGRWPIHAIRIETSQPELGRFKD